MYECLTYGGFYTITGKTKNYICIAGTDEWGNVVTGRVPKKYFIRHLRKWRKYKWIKSLRTDKFSI